MMPSEPVRIIALGFILVVFGFVLAVLMTIQTVEASFLLGLISYLSSFGGLFLGMMGTALYVRDQRRKE
jgi:hypothetical protein